MPRAGLAPDSVTAAAADLADEVGIERLTMGMLAERLGVKTPSLYKHVGGLDDLTHRIAVLAMTELADAVRDAIKGLSDTEALTAAARTMRAFVNQRPGRYIAGNTARPISADDSLGVAKNRLLESFASVLHGYNLDPSNELHALRMLRSALHGFATLENSDGFQLDEDVDASFGWMVGLLDQGLRSIALRIELPARRIGRAN